MATVNDIREDIANRLGDPAMELVYPHQLLEFINSAARDASGYGVVIEIEGTFSYAADVDVPSDFLHIHDLWQASNVWIPWHQWSIRYSGADPQIHFDTIFTAPSGTITVLGHGRPNVAYSAGSDVIDLGLEAFISARAMSYAARQLAQLVEGAAAQNIENIANVSWQESVNLLQTLGMQPQFRPKHYSRGVPRR